MLETLTAGLLLAAISGISYLAYKHPPAFRKVYFPLVALTVLILIMLVMWNFWRLDCASQTYATH